MSSPTSRPQLANQVIDVIFNSLNLRHIEKSKVSEDTPLMKDGLNLDSVDILEVVVNLEQQFNFKLKENETGAQYFRSVGTVVDLIESRMSSPQT